MTTPPHVPNILRLFAAFSLLLDAGCHSRMGYPSGGYPYPKYLTGKDTQFYCYPVKDKETRRDSILDALNYVFWQSADEPNLSLRPMPTDVFRFVYSEALNPTTYIIRLTPTGLVVKTATPTEEFDRLPDTNRLTPLDRLLIRILESNYPIDDTGLHRSPWKRHYLDSMGRLYPQLYSTEYYLSVRNKEYPHLKPWFNFTSRTIILKPGEFERLVSVINKSGFWELPYEMPCQDRPMDGWGYSLEANTAMRYNYVGAGSCVPDTGSFTKACQTLVNFAGLERKIRLVWNPTIVADTSVQLEDVKEPRKP
jgi:hypothetical protein